MPSFPWTHLRRDQLKSCFWGGGVLAKGHGNIHPTANSVWECSNNPDPDTSEKVSWYKWDVYVMRMGDVYTASSQEKGIFLRRVSWYKWEAHRDTFQKHRGRNSPGQGSPQHVGKRPSTMALPHHFKEGAVYIKWLCLQSRFVNPPRAHNPL